MKTTRKRFSNLVVLAAVVAAVLLPLSRARAANAAAPKRPLPTIEKAVFAGGCFWCVEAAFEGLPGVKTVESGFSGGAEERPTYEQVSSGRTGHAEVVEITFDPTAISHKKLLDVFWHNIDPTQAGAQFCDHGEQYRSAIFYASDAQRRAALESLKRLERSNILKKPIVTQIVALTRFWPAEEYHQDYYKKNPAHYQAYRLGCGRDRRLRELWGADAGRH
ncbi:MAG: peptide-methionine (S)-S-oxide reductase MsrA [Candidatus Eisenbacteria bacterium]